MKFYSNPLALLGITFFAASVQAQVVETSQISRFEGLQQVFEQAARPEIANLLDRPMAGRCFMSTEPNAPVGSVLLLRAARSTTTNSGPLEAPKYEVFTVGTRSAQGVDKLTTQEIRAMAMSVPAQLIAEGVRQYEFSDGQGYSSEMRETPQEVIMRFTVPELWSVVCSWSKGPKS